MRFAFLICLLTLLNACASINKEQCADGDWLAIGLEDARQGYPANRLQQHSNVCQKHAITPDKRTYLEGWNKGLQDFCTRKAGQRYGRHGLAYAGICPADTQADFLHGYQSGLHRAIASKQRRIHHLEQEQILHYPYHKDRRRFDYEYQQYERRYSKILYLHSEVSRLMYLLDKLHYEREHSSSPDLE